ncbi:MAG: hypothetical protein NVS4B7_20180 [Ktedonobacteraceae bacterium]
MRLEQEGNVNMNSGSEPADAGQTETPAETETTDYGQTETKRS